MRFVYMLDTMGRMLYVYYDDTRFCFDLFFFFRIFSQT